MNLRVLYENFWSLMNQELIWLLLLSMFWLFFLKFFTVQSVVDQFDSIRHSYNWYTLFNKFDLITCWVES
jgi:hypothetical protein